MATYHAALMEDQDYVVFFQYGHADDGVVTTDAHGFRISRSGERRCSLVEASVEGRYNVLLGSSAAFGMGTTGDEASLASQLWSREREAAPWLNMAGRAFNSAQELILFSLFAPFIHSVGTILVLSGVNNLVLSRLAAQYQGRHGAVFSDGAHLFTTDVPSLHERLTRAIRLTGTHLSSLAAISSGLGARLVYVLQPFAPWVRAVGSEQEQALFRELDEASSFMHFHADIADARVGRTYADMLARTCASLGVEFHDANEILARTVKSDEWLFVDRIHLNDHGYSVLADVVMQILNASPDQTTTRDERCGSS